MRPAIAKLQACYASIGWSIGATLGYGVAEPRRRVITVVGDGAAQMTVQASTPIQWEHSLAILVFGACVSACVCGASGSGRLG